MSSNSASSKVVTVDEQAFERTEDAGVDEDGFEVVDETPELRATVEQETQAKVDSNHPDGIVQDFSHLPLAQEERIRAREAELERISAQAELGMQHGRAERTREVVTEKFRRLSRRTVTTAEAGDVDPTPDPRETLTQDELATVNQEAQRIAAKVTCGPSRAAIARILAKQVADGRDTTTAVFNTLETVKRMPGVIIPIDEVPDVPVSEVSVSGEIIELWRPSSSAISQVGLIADESGKIKFTSWSKSDQKGVREGDRVQIKYAKKNWYRGRCSIALTYDSRIVFPERDRRWWKR
jgi:hypothetical protein